MSAVANLPASGELLSATALALRIGRSRATLYRMIAESAVPSPVRKAMWSRVEIEAWIAAGMPRRSRWEAKKR